MHGGTTKCEAREKRGEAEGVLPRGRVGKMSFLAEPSDPGAPKRVGPGVGGKMAERVARGSPEKKEERLRGESKEGGGTICSFRV